MPDPIKTSMGFDVDEESLSHEERLGLAYCRLNCWEWDEYVGAKPDDFDELPNCTPRPRFRFMKRKKSKSTYLSPARQAITSIIGEAKTSWYWWRFHLNKPYDEWVRWYISGNLPFEQ